MSQVKAGSGQLGKNKGRRRVQRSERSGGVPWLGQEFKVGDLSPARLGTQVSSGAARLKHYRPPSYSPSILSPSTSPLIGFNERFNKTALPDQIKLLLSATLNPGSLLCNASATQCSAFCKVRPASLLAPTLTHSPPTPPPSSCLFLLMSTLSNPEQAEKPPPPLPCPKTTKFSQDRSHLGEGLFLVLGSRCDRTNRSKGI